MWCFVLYAQQGGPNFFASGWNPYCQTIHAKDFELVILFVSVCFA